MASGGREPSEAVIEEVTEVSVLDERGELLGVAVIERKQLKPQLVFSQ
jgi:hypothetical protein